MVVYYERDLQERGLSLLPACSLKILNEFPKVLDNVSLDLAKRENLFQLSIESKVDSPLVTIERFNRQFRLGEKEKRGCRVWLERNFGLDAGKGWGNIKDIIMHV